MIPYSQFVGVTQYEPLSSQRGDDLLYSISLLLHDQELFPDFSLAEILSHHPARIQGTRSRKAVFCAPGLRRGQDAGCIVRLLLQQPKSRPNARHNPMRGMFAVRGS